VVDEIAAAVAGTPGVTLLDCQSDGHHNRSVLTFVGEAAAAGEGAFRAIAAAARLIDLTRHEALIRASGPPTWCPSCRSEPTTWRSA